ncbi:MAG: putative carboxyvinyl-carboxyphosphonate phosphorylmutase [Actinomycetia bacterium]|nr:putative carboxyvinyl-carboxyphosphonate phosphorylmutase [Actinomycetes bacterium]
MSSDVVPSAPPSFRQLLDSAGLIVAPGAYDAITARLVEQAGFPLVYMTGAGTAAARGYPDYGLLTMTEMVENAAVLARSVAVPVLADADTGFGNELNVTRTVREYETRGVAGIHLEDQVSPKRCGHLDGKQVIDRARFTSLVAAAVEARASSDFVVVARTDAVATEGLDEAIDRANAALDVGADVAFVEALTTIDEVAAVPTRVHGPCLLNIVPGGKTPVNDLTDVASMGYRIALCPGLLLGATVMVGDIVLKELAETNRHPSSGKGSVGDFFARFGGAEWDDIRRRFADDESAAARP